MGLDFSHCEASWAYSGFMRFRVKLAKEIGIDLIKMQGFTDNGLSWAKIKDPIVPLLYHSDCDGELTVEECKAVAPRLRELVADWPDHDFDKSKALELAFGMETAADAGEPLAFR
jgi:hypothetical protein